MAARKTTSAKAAPQLLSTKASMGASDSDLLVGTIADSNATQVPDSDLYYLLFKKQPYVRACVRLIANAVAQEGFSVSKIDGDDTQPLDDHEDPRERQLVDFFRQAFAPKTFRSAIKATAIDIEIYGWAFWLKVRTGKVLTGFKRLDPRMIAPKLNKEKTEIESFVQKKNNATVAGIVVEQAGETIIPASEVVMFTLDEGGDVLLGAPSPLEALDITTAMDLNIRVHRNSYFKNGATTGNIISVKDATEEQARSIQKRVDAQKVGVGNAYRNWFMAGDVEVKSLMQSGKQDLDFTSATEIVRDEICAVFNVPVSKLINVSGSMGQAGKGEDDETFEQECILPLEELLYSTITAEVLVKELQIDDLEIVPKRRNAMRYDRISAAMNLVKCGGTGNEARAIIGLASSDADGMDIPLFIGAGKSVSEDEPTTQANQAPAMDGSVGQSVAVQDKNEVAGKASPRFRGRSFRYY